MNRDRGRDASEKPPRLTPSPNPPSPEGELAAEGSEASSTVSSAATTSPLVGEAGPAFDPRAAADAPTPERLAPEPTAPAVAGALAMEWDPAVVRSLLEGKGNLLHGAFAIDPESDEWRYTKRDLSAIAPPLTRILNRYDATRAAAGAGDEMALMVGLGGYVTRSVRERKAALEYLRAVQAHEAPPAMQPADEEIAGGGPDWGGAGDAGVTNWEPESEV